MAYGLQFFDLEKPERQADSVFNACRADSRSEKLMVKDLVCGMDVNEKISDYSMVFEGEMYFFCSEGCWSEFRRHPQEYLRTIDFCCEKPLEEKSDV